MVSKVVKKEDGSCECFCAMESIMTLGLSTGIE